MAREYRHTGSMSSRRAGVKSTTSPVLGVATLCSLLIRRFRRQHIAFLLACLYLIFEYNRPQQVWPALGFFPWAQSLILGGLFFAALDRQSRMPPVIVNLLMALFAFSMMMSTAFAFRTQVALDEWAVWISWILVVVFLTSVLSNRERVLLFVFVFYLVNLKMAQHGFRTWAARGFGMASWGVTGSPGWFQNSGEFGMQMAMLVPLLVAHLTVARHKLSRTTFAIGTVFLAMVVGSIIASNSRGAVLGLIAAAIALLVRARLRLKTVILVALSTAAVIAVIPDGTMERFRTAGEDTTSISRLTYWRYGIEAVRDHPLFGIGFRNWIPYVAEKHPEAADFYGEVEVIHNTYLEAATELGILGFTVFASTLLLIVVINRRTVARAHAIGDDWISATAAGLNGGLLVYMVTCSFMSVLMYPYLWMLLVLSVGCSTATERDPRSKGRHSPQRSI